jgi:hypothetical protein
MMLNNFISRSVSQYQSLSFFDSLRSTMPLYFFMGFLILYIGGIILLLSGVKGSKWMLLFCGFIVFVGWSWVKLYQRYELKAPVKKKIFNYRLAQGLEQLPLLPGITMTRKRIITAQMETGDKPPHNLTIRYSQDLWRNVGGIIPGTPVQTIRKIHPRTWFLEITGNTRISPKQPVIYDFSARKNDKDPDGGFGVHLYEAKTFKDLSPATHDPEKLIPKIRSAIDGTILKGYLVLSNGTFELRIFDNIQSMRRWHKPPVGYAAFKNSDRLKAAGVSAERAAFYGIDKILKMLVH